MFNPKAPLWLPYGSVRAILALVIAAVTCALVLTDRITGEAFLAIASAVIAFYFGAKSATNPNLDGQG